MAKNMLYDFEANGRIYTFEGPEGLDPTAFSSALQQQIAIDNAPKTGGMGEAFKGTAKRMLSSGRTALESVIDPDKAAVAGLERQKAITELPGGSLAEVQRVIETEGLPAGIWEGIKQAPAVISGQIPQLGGMFAAGTAAAAVTPPVLPIVGPFAKPIAGVLGGLASLAIPQTGTNIERQAQVQQEAGLPVDVSMAKAVPAAIGSAALDQVALLAGGLGKVLGIGVKELGTVAAERIAKESLLKASTKGVGKTALAEMPTEVSQQMLERAQAGLPLTTPDAIQEYADAAYQALLMSPLGGLGGVSSRSQAKGQVAAAQALKDQAAADKTYAIEQAKGFRDQAREDRAGTQAVQAEIARQATETKQQAVDVLQQVAAKKQAEAGIPAVNDLMQTKEGASQLLSDKGLFEYHFPKTQYTADDIKQLKNDIRARRNTLPSQESIARATTQAELEQTFAVDPNTITPELIDMWGITKGNKKLRNKLLAVSDLTVPDNKVKATELLEDYKQTASAKQLSAAETATQHIANLEPVSVEAPNVGLNERTNRASVPVLDERGQVSPAGIAGVEPATLGDVGDSTGLLTDGTEQQPAALVEESPAAVQARVQARILEKRQAEAAARAEEKAANLAAVQAEQKVARGKIIAPTAAPEIAPDIQQDVAETQAREAELSPLADTESTLIEPYAPTDENILASAAGKKKARKPKYAMPERIEPSDTSASVEAIQTELNTLFTPQQLKARPPVVVDTVEELPANLQAEATEADAAAFVDPTTKQEYYVASKIPSNDIRGKIQHERGAHVGLTKLIGKDRVNALANRVLTWATEVGGKKIEHVIAREAHEKALMSEEEEGSERYNQEVIAYFTEIAVNRYGIDPLKTQPKEFAKVAGWLKELWNGILATIKKLHYDPSKLTTKEIVDLVYGAARIANKAEPSAVGVQAGATPALSDNDLTILVGLLQSPTPHESKESTGPETSTKIQSSSASSMMHDLGFKNDPIKRAFINQFYNEIKQFGYTAKAVTRFIESVGDMAFLVPLANVSEERILSQLPEKTLVNVVNADYATREIWENPKQAAEQASARVNRVRNDNYRRTTRSMYHIQFDYYHFSQEEFQMAESLITFLTSKYSMVGDAIKEMTDKNEYLPVSQLSEEFVNQFMRLLEQGNSPKNSYAKAYKQTILAPRDGIIEAALGPTKTGWMHFSGVDDADRLTMVASDTGTTAQSPWCIGNSSQNFAQNYLEKGDFYLYIDRGNSIVSARFQNDNPNYLEEFSGLGVGVNQKVPKEHQKYLYELDRVVGRPIDISKYEQTSSSAVSTVEEAKINDAGEKIKKGMSSPKDFRALLEEYAKAPYDSELRKLLDSRNRDIIFDVLGVSKAFKQTFDVWKPELKTANTEPTIYEVMPQITDKYENVSEAAGHVIAVPVNVTKFESLPKELYQKLTKLKQEVLNAPDIYTGKADEVNSLSEIVFYAKTDSANFSGSNLNKLISSLHRDYDEEVAFRKPFEEWYDSLTTSSEMGLVDLDVPAHRLSAEVFDSGTGGVEVKVGALSLFKEFLPDENILSAYHKFNELVAETKANKVKSVADKAADDAEIRGAFVKQGIQPSAAPKTALKRPDGTEIKFKQQEKETLWENLADVFNGSSTPWRSLMDMLGNKIVTGRYTVERKAIDAGLSATDAKTQGKIRADLIGLQATNAMSLAQAGLFYGKLVLRKSGIIRAEKGNVNMVDLGNEWHTLLEKATRDLGSADRAYDMLSAGWYGPRYEDLAKHNANTAPKNRVDISDWTDSDKQTSAEAWRRYGPELTKLRDMRNEMRGSVLDLMVQSGLYTRDVAKEYLDRMDYVPLYRIQEKDLLDKQGRPLRVSTGLLGVGREFHLKGSSKTANDPLQNYIANMSWMMQRAIKNNAAIHTADMLDALGQGYWSKNKVPSGKKQSMHVASIFKDGVEKDFVMYDPNDMAAFSATPIISGLVWDLMRYPVSGLRHGITMMPQFVFNQAMEDPVRAALVSGNRAGIAQNVRDTWKSIADNQFKSERTPDADMLNRYGVIGQKDILDAKDIEDMYHGNDKKGYRKYIYFLERMAQGSDLGARESIYKNAVKELTAEGYDKDTAEDLASIRSQQYMPYQQVGMSKSLAYLRRMMPFVNPPIQGLARDIAAMRGRLTGVSKADGKKMFALTITKYAVFTAMYAAFSSGDDDYENKTDDQKDNNFYLGGVRIAVPQELRPLKVAIERGTRYYILNEPNADVNSAAIAGTVLRKSWEIISGIALPVPTAVRPLLENMTNFDIYSARPVVGISQQSKAPMYQYTDTTSELAKTVGEALNYSPIKIDHILRGYFGYMGQTIAQFLNVLDTERPSMRLQDLPIVGGFVEGQYGTGPKNELYELIGKSAEAKATLKSIQKEGDREAAIKWARDHRGSIGLSTAVNALHTQVTNIRTNKSKIYNSKLSAPEKRARLDALEKAELRLLSNVHELHKRMVELDA
jgi:hypothetical protein